MKNLPALFATSNENKLREFSEILGVEIEGVSVDVPEIQSLDLKEVSRYKALEAYRLTNKPVLVEDTGLIFDAWGELPGPLITWFLDSVGNDGLLKQLESFSNRDALAQTAVSYHDGTQTHTFIGEIRGSIAQEPRGETGFGWDPIFIPEGFDKTFAEMSVEEKNSVSMRKRALEKLTENSAT